VGNHKSTVHFAIGLLTDANVPDVLTTKITSNSASVQVSKMMVSKVVYYMDSVLATGFYNHEFQDILTGDHA